MTLSPSLEAKLAEALPCICGMREGHSLICPGRHRSAVSALIADRDRRITELEAENERLTGQLRRIADFPDYPCERSTYDRRAIARAALAKGGEDRR